MKVLIDTNIILDVLFNRESYVEEASKVFKLCEIKKIEGCIYALSVPNIIYVMRKELNEAKTNEILEKLFLIFNVADLKADDLNKAAKLNFADYEDALQSVCATRIKADYIISRNIKDFTKSKVTAIKPSELLERI